MSQASQLSFISSSTGQIVIAATTASVSTTTGALQVAGGVGIGGGLYVGGIVTITNTASSVSTTTGALVVTGGVGLGGSLYAGNLSGPAASRLGVILNQDSTIGFQVYGAYSTSQLRLTYPAVADWDHLLTSAGSYTISGTGVFNLGGTAVKVTGTAVSTSTTTGALQVAGGVGIGGSLYVGALRADATSSATTFAVYYNAVTKELTTSTAATGGGGGNITLGNVITSAMGWNLT